MRNSDQTECEGNFKIRNWKLIVDVGISVIITVFMGSFFIVGLFFAIREAILSFPPSNIYENVLIIGLFVLAALHAFMIALFVFGAVMNIRGTYRMFSMCVGSTRTGISIITRAGKCFIDKSEFLHVLGYKHVLQLIWKHGDYHTLLSFERNLLGKVSFAQMQELVTGWDLYTEDYEEKMAIRTKFRPTNIFSTGRKIWKSYWKDSI